MEIRVLRYFLAVVREESISGAAEYLHLTQPTLSRRRMAQKGLIDWLGKIGGAEHRYQRPPDL